MSGWSYSPYGAYWGDPLSGFTLSGVKISSLLTAMSIECSALLTPAGVSVSLMDVSAVSVSEGITFSDVTCIPLLSVANIVNNMYEVLA